MHQILPLNDYLIVEVIKNPEVSVGGIVIPEKFIAESCTGKVVKQNPVSYYRDGSLRQPLCDVGDVVLFAQKSGTTVVHAPNGKTWLAIPEDCIYYKVLEVDCANS